MARERPSFLRRLRSIEEIGAVAGLLSICVLLWLSTGEKFANPSNLLQVARQGSSYGILSVGMTLLLAMGEIDLSVGAILTLVNVVTAIALREGTPMPLAVFLGLALGTSCGFLNGLLGVALRIPTIIVTLGTLSVFRGLALVFSNATAVANFSKESLLFQLGSRSVLGLPTGVLVMLLVGGAGHVLLKHTAFGWRLQAIGSNAQAARFSGISLPRYRVAAMTLMGLISGIAGVMELAFLQSGSPTTGQGYELYVIASVIIGGTALAGGRGTIVGALLGALLIAVIRNGLVLLELSAYWGTAVTGAVIIAAVAVGNLVKKQ
ncbi:MAG: ABC transporter permease [Verrucomicrobia bacterium]|nr:ABC transporter permease [Verrucomicrobiota bacterium]MBI3870283.1 ABC transporter permease [Verrucomicrobiota bacterium]